MLSDEELVKICDKRVPKCRDELIQQYFRHGFWDAVKAIRKASEKPAAPKPTGETVEVRLPVVVDKNRKYSCQRGFYEEDEYWLRNAIFTQQQQGGLAEVQIVTAKLPIPKPREPIEVKGEVEG